MRWVSPVPRSNVCFVSSLRSSTSAGSSSCRRASAEPSLSSSACVRARIASASTGGGGSMPATRTGRALRRERVARRGGGQLRHRGDVARGDARDGVLFLAAHREQRVQPLVGAGPRVHEVVVGLHRAGQHLEQRELADVGVSDRLEHERERLAVRIGRDLLLGSGCDHLDAGTIARARARSRR